MKYYLATLLDEEARSKARNQLRKLQKYKRNIHFKDLEALHFVYKYLGEDVSSETLNAVHAKIKDWSTSVGLGKFIHQSGRIKLGKRGELIPSKINFELQSDPSIKQFNRKLHQLTIAADDYGSREIIRKKDHEGFLGKVHLAQVKRNTAPGARKEIKAIIGEMGNLGEITVDNISIISIEVYKSGAKQRLYSKIELD